MAARQASFLGGGLLASVGGIICIVLVVLLNRWLVID